MVSGSIHQYAGDKVSLHHNHPDCTGEWGVRHRGGGQDWVCDRCGAVGHMSEATNSEAILENVRGTELEQLTKEGRKLLQED